MLVQMTMGSKHQNQSQDQSPLSSNGPSALEFMWLYSPEPNLNECQIYWPTRLLSSRLKWNTRVTAGWVTTEHFVSELCLSQTSNGPLWIPRFGVWPSRGREKSTDADTVSVWHIPHPNADGILPLRRPQQQVPLTRHAPRRPSEGFQRFVMLGTTVQLPIAPTQTANMSTSAPYVLERLEQPMSSTRPFTALVAQIVARWH